MLDMGVILHLSLKEEHRLRVFKNRVLRRTFGPTKDEVTGKWRRLNHKELYDLYSSPNIIQLIESRKRWGGHMACTGDKRGAQGFGGKT
jgi:hypothetical protein